MLPSLYLLKWINIVYHMTHDICNKKVLKKIYLLLKNKPKMNIMAPIQNGASTIHHDHQINPNNLAIIKTTIAVSISHIIIIPP